MSFCSLIVFPHFCGSAADPAAGVFLLLITSARPYCVAAFHVAQNRHFVTVLFFHILRHPDREPDSYIISKRGGRDICLHSVSRRMTFLCISVTLILLIGTISHQGQM